MSKKSSITRLPDEARKHIELRLREGRLTLDELLADIRAHFPHTQPPSRSSLGRYSAGFTEMAGRMREIETAAAVLVDELGEGMGDKAGALLAQAVTTLAANAALRANESDDDMSIKEIGELARAARAAMQARTMSIKERQIIEEAARAKLLRQQEAALSTVVKSGGLSAASADEIRRSILGVAA